MPRLAALSKYWHEHPPTHLLVAAYLGYKPKASNVNNPDELAALFGALRPKE